jgi:hypothetical protein
MVKMKKVLFPACLSGVWKVYHSGTGDEIFTNEKPTKADIKKIAELQEWEPDNIECTRLTVLNLKINE